MNIINLGILAHIDAGKTSVTENLLFACGATEKRGSVDKGDTITDSMDIEKRRGITIRASTTSIVWNGVKCNIIDTPGHMDFIAEVERTFKMLDGAVLILSAKEGIQAQTKLLFKTLQKLQIPTIIFINKIDRAGVNLERLYLDIKTNLSQDVLFMWKSHATLTLLAKQDLAPFGYNMIDPLKSWCWGSILFYPFKISRFS